MRPQCCSLRLLRRWHSVLIVQPLRKKLRSHRDTVPPERQLAEAKALVESITGWSIEGCLTPNMKRNTKRVFTTGVYADLTDQIRSSKASAVFLNVSMMTGLQTANLAAEWRRPVFDRYSIVLQAFNDRAVSREAKLQIQLAEMPLRMARAAVVSQTAIAEGRGASELVARQQALNAMEAEKMRLRAALAEIEARKVAQSDTRRRQIATVAVVGYTNAGKTSLVGQLSRKDSLEPEDRLFATLHSSHHRCRLPCGLPCLMVDTIGFLSDLPTILVAPFRTTLRDSLNADLLLHLVDCSDPDWPQRKQTVISTLETMGLSEQLRLSMLTVFNKCDLLGLQSKNKDWTPPHPPPDSLQVSCTTGLNLDALQATLQSRLIDIMSYSRLKIRCSPASPLYQWLLLNRIVIESAVACGPEDQLAMQLLMSPQQLGMFRARFRPVSSGSTGAPDNKCDKETYL